MYLNDEQLRGLANAGQLYDTWKEVMAGLARLPGGMYWRVINSREYLYQYAPGPAGRQQSKSLGPKSPHAERTFEEFKQAKEALDARRTALEQRLKEFAPAWRALRLPAIDRTAGKILRTLDRAGLIGSGILVVGTYALKAYEVEAASSFAAGMDATEDLDFTLMVGEPADADLPRRLLLTLKQADASFLVSPGSPATAVNRSGYRIDLLASPATAAQLAPAQPWKPEVLEGQEWLLSGKPVSAVVIDFEGWPVRLAAPDPRWFALQKLWLSGRSQRPAIKREKDRRQAEALLAAITAQMPQYPMDARFVASLPKPLQKLAAGKTKA